MTKARLEGKVVVVGGATRGIGRGIAEHAAANGAAVVVTGRTVAAGEAVVAAIETAGGTATFVATDLTDEDQVAGAFEAALSRFGRVDGVVCNAAAMELTRVDGPISEISLDDWNSIIQANLTSVFLTAKHGIRAMLQSRARGSLVLISSMAAVRGLNGLDAYTAAKGGLVSLSRSISSYYARYDIRCNCLAVGFVDSGASVIGESAGPPQHDQRLWRHHLGILGEPSDVAAASTYLLADESRYVAGTTVAIDGGAIAASHFPRPAAADIARFPRVRERAPQC